MGRRPISFFIVALMMTSSGVNSFTSGVNSFTSSLFGSNTVIVVTRVTTQPVLWPIDDPVVSGLIDPDLGL